MAIRSLLETVACQHLIRRRGFVPGQDIFDKAYQQAEILAAKLHAFRKSLDPQQKWIREGESIYVVDE
jgi:hypothetical protein